MSFIWPWLLLTLLFVPLCVGIYSWLQNRRMQSVAALGPLGMVKSSSGHEIGKRRHVPPTLFLIGLTFLFFGLARPEMMVSLPHIEGTVILVFDVSNSMLADDLHPTRIEAAKAAARVFIENQPSTIQVGVVAFSNGGLIVQAPTNDQILILDAIERLSPQGGTSLGQGIFTSLNAIAGEAIAIEISELKLDEQSVQIGYYPSSVILLLTDGDNTGPPDPLEISQLAADAGVRIYPVGIGTTEGTILEIDGFNVLTQLNEASLQDIASLTNGHYYHAEDEKSLQEIYKKIDLQLTIEGEKSEITSVFAGISLIFLLVGGVLSLSLFGRMP